ncbi:hypothetical protein SK128_022520 [Halocaridina rubra]|uniref:Uncharacterized protein n=1 Tax=Halocaridina rubra TaxID=373956 RepID=A0AAN8ZVD3_HALRR
MAMKLRRFTHPNSLDSHIKLSQMLSLKRNQNNRDLYRVTVPEAEDRSREEDTNSEEGVCPPNASSHERVPAKAVVDLQSSVWCRHLLKVTKILPLMSVYVPCLLTLPTEGADARIFEEPSRFFQSRGRGKLYLMRGRRKKKTPINFLPRNSCVRLLVTSIEKECRVCQSYIIRILLPWD